MKILLPYTLCSLLLWCGCHWESSLAFVVDLTLPHHRLNNGARSSSSSLFYNEPFDSDFLDERTRRSELVRILQNTFQKNNNREASSINRMMTLPPQHGVFQNMPLWRDDYTELPGSQHAMNVTDANFVDLLLRVVSSRRPWYYGHLYLPGGSQNADSFEYRLESPTKAPLVGTLLQISDYRIVDDGPHLEVIVQALGRFCIGDVVLRHGSPYAIATIELLPDEELVEAQYRDAQRVLGNLDFSLNDNTRGAACAGAVEEAAQWHEFEFQPVDWNQPWALASPVSNLNPGAIHNNTDQAIHTAMEEYLGQSPVDMYQGECSLGDDFFTDDESPNDNITINNNTISSKEDSSQLEMSLMDQTLHLERDVWIELDKFARLQASLENKNNSIWSSQYTETLKLWPLPPQVLALMPRPPLVRPWPKFFGLSKFVRKMDRLDSLVNNNNHSKLQFAEGYPTLRRSRRLSYVVWALLGRYTNMVEEAYEGLRGTAFPTKQDILEMDSTAERLTATKKTIQRINKILLLELEDDKDNKSNPI